MRLRRLHSVIWLLCTLLLVQSLLPASAAVAFVSVRCVDAPAAAPPCAHALLPAEGGFVAGTHLAPMACCRHMGGSRCSMRASNMHPASAGPHTSPRFAEAGVQTALPCVFTVSLVGTERTAGLPCAHPFLMTAAALETAPAARLTLWPPAVSETRPVPVFALPPGCRAQAHGLRAPPAA